MRRTVLPVVICAVVASSFWLGRSQGLAAPDRPKSAVFKLSEIAAQPSPGPWHPIFETSTLRTGLYVLPVQGVDHQGPHAVDEIYHVFSGKAVLDIDGENHPVEPGAVLYVRAGVPHHFHSVTEPLKVLVFFAGKG
jgi:mannose-6-phosphate isomerase-like protein (cupin superfamily)